MMMIADSSLVRVFYVEIYLVLFLCFCCSIKNLLCGCAIQDFRTVNPSFISVTIEHYNMLVCFFLACHKSKSYCSENTTNVTN